MPCYFCKRANVWRHLYCLQVKCKQKAPKSVKLNLKLCLNLSWKWLCRCDMVIPMHHLLRNKHKKKMQKCRLQPECDLRTTKSGKRGKTESNKTDRIIRDRSGAVPYRSPCFCRFRFIVYILNGGLHIEYRVSCRLQIQKYCLHFQPSMTLTSCHKTKRYRLF